MGFRKGAAALFLLAVLLVGSGGEGTHSRGQGREDGRCEVSIRLPR